MRSIPSTESPHASVVIATRNRPRDLARCLDALRQQQSARAFEVIVVDDGSAPPLTQDHLAALPKARLLHGPGRGPAAARNVGILAARSPIVIFTDDDTSPSSTWVESACRFLNNNPACVGVEGPTVSAPFDSLYEHSVENKRAEAGAYFTCNVAYRRDVLERLDGFCESFPFPHGEDLDLGWRALRIGEIGFEPGMTVTHYPRPVSIRELVARGRFAANEVFLGFRHLERFPARTYGLRPSAANRIWPALHRFRYWRRRVAAEHRALLRSPRRLGRFSIVAFGDTAVALAVGLTTRLPRATGTPARGS
jgi:GT2 family glycosyltransferase